MDPTSFIDEFRVRQVVSDVGRPTRVHRNIHGAALRVVAVGSALNGLVERLGQIVAAQIFIEFMLIYYLLSVFDVDAS